MSNSEFDISELIQGNSFNNKRKRSNNEKDPIEYIQRKADFFEVNENHYNFDVRLHLDQKNVNLRLYIKNFRMLLSKEQKRINRRMTNNDVIKFEDFLEKGTIEVTNQIIFKIFDDITEQKRKQGSDFNVIKYLDEKLALFDNLDSEASSPASKKTKKTESSGEEDDDSSSDYNPNDFASSESSSEESEEIIDDENDEVEFIDDEEDEEDEDYSVYSDSSGDETSDAEEIVIRIKRDQLKELGKC